MLAQGNVGEDLNQLRGRYGSAKKVGGQMLFEVHIVDNKVVRLPPSDDQHEGYTVTVYFDGIHSGMEIFTHNTSDPAKANIGQDDAKIILDSESDGKSWNPIQVHSGKPTWLRSDNKLLARLSAANGKADDASVMVIMVNGK